MQSLAANRIAKDASEPTAERSLEGEAGYI